MAGESILGPTDFLAPRHIGPSEDEIAGMLRAVGATSLEALVAETIPSEIRSPRALALPAPRAEHEVLRELAAMAAQNEVFRSFIGMGYHDCLTPAVIQRNVLENPGWYTQYTPYQAEISQGRLEALLNFQTMVADLTGLPLANASLLDEATAAAEAMHMARALTRDERTDFFVAADCHPQTIAVARTRARPLGIRLQVGPPEEADLGASRLFGILLSYPTTDGRLVDYASLVERAHAAGVLVTVATDLLALAVVEAPGKWGADLVVGSSQRFGVPLGFGGPHAAFLAARDEYKRQLPGRIVGVSRDAEGRPAYRLALQTREQHIRRDKATSNICTAQVLPAVMAGFYAVYHGREGLARIARRVHGLTEVLAAGLRALGRAPGPGPFFDTLRIGVPADEGAAILERARARRINLRAYPDGSLGVALDETVAIEEIDALLEIFAGGAPPLTATALARDAKGELPAPFARKSPYLDAAVFNIHHSEHAMLRYLHRLQAKDLSLTTSMIPLGSCTMKLNATTEMVPVSWPGFGKLHPFAPDAQTRGYTRLFSELAAWLCEITGFAAVSLQPNSGSQGEYAGLLAVRAYHESRGEPGRDVCLIPISAHGTNPASAVTAGFRVVAVACDARGNVDLGDLESKAREHSGRLGALMITYPSTHGVFEERAREICEIVHRFGGQVYMDGANMNAQVGLTSPSLIGADVCHLNLHKTFCIPHGGGGPGMGPIGVAAHLAPFLPSHPLAGPGPGGVGPVSAAPHGSSSILVVSWAYIAMMGGEGLRRATEVAILAANYMAQRLSGHYDVLYSGKNKRVAHEFILDGRGFKRSGIEVEDIAKRLMDYGFHAPTMSFPVAGTLMIEPTESESRAELDRFCDALIAIRVEIREVEAGGVRAEDSALRLAPHTARAVTASDWDRAYSRESAAFPAPWVRDHKFWPAVARVDNTHGDRHLVCTCPPVEAFAG